MKNYDVIMIGCSLGGLKALQALLPRIADDCDTPIVIIQHRDPDFGGELLEKILQRSSSHIIEEAEDKMPLEKGHVYVAPADYHLMIEGKRIVLSTDAPVAYARPSINVALESAARSMGPRVLAVILTGKGKDGSEGVAHVESRGGTILVEDPRTAECDSMPRAALATTHTAHVLNLEEIGRFICGLSGSGERSDVRRASC